MNIRKNFLEGMSKAACTVSVITAEYGGEDFGVTVSAMCSVSADPPSLLVCIHNMSPACKAIMASQYFCVNVLKGSQSDIADTFAGRIKTEDGNKFSCAEWIKRPCGALAMQDALVVFDCELKEHTRCGSHYIFIADVADITCLEMGQPLIYADRAYGMPQKFVS